MATIERKLKNCVKSDVDDITTLLYRKYDRPVRIRYDKSYDENESQNADSYDVGYNIVIEDMDTGAEITFLMEYGVDNGKILYYNDLDETAEEIDSLLADQEDVSASTHVNRNKKISIRSNSALKDSSYVKGAEGDEDADAFADDDTGFEGSEFTFDDEEPLDDTLDEMSDQLEDMQDQLDEVQEDDPSIQTDNNIANHYIVECDKCKGVFISSIKESDAEIEKVSGRCPLCGKDSDQYLKWIIRNVNDDEQ